MGGGVDGPAGSRRLQVVAAEPAGGVGSGDLAAGGDVLPDERAGLPGALNVGNGPWDLGNQSGPWDPFRRRRCWSG